MKEVFYIIFILLLQIDKVNSQTIQYTLLDSSFQNINIAEIDSIVTESSKSGFILEKINRKIIPNYNEYITKFFTTDITLYHIRILYKENNKPLFYLVTKATPSTNTDTIKYFVDNNELRVYLNTFKTSHKMAIDPIQEFEINVFGTYCGAGGTHPDLTVELKKFVKRKEINKLRIWLRSTNPEKQLYGAIGLIILQKYKRKNLTTKDKDIIEELKNRNTEVYTCEGCYYGNMKPIRKLLEEEYVTYFYRTVIKK